MFEFVTTVTEQKTYIDKNKYIQLHTYTHTNE